MVQTIKTKIVTEEIENYCNEKAMIIDAHGGVKAVFQMEFQFWQVIGNTT